MAYMSRIQSADVVKITVIISHHQAINLSLKGPIITLVDHLKLTAVPTVDSSTAQDTGQKNIFICGASDYLVAKYIYSKHFVRHVKQNKKASMFMSKYQFSTVVRTVVVEHRTQNREVMGSISTGGTVLCL